MPNFTYDQLLDEAYKQMEAVDKESAEAGEATLRGMGPREVIRLAIEALEAGAATRTILPVAQAVIMLNALLHALCEQTEEEHAN